MKFKMPSPGDTRFNGPFIVCILAICVTAVMAIAAMPGVVSAFFSPPPETNTNTVLDELLENHEVFATVGRDRFVGRSPFFVPKRPPSRPRARPVVREPVSTPEPVEPSPPPGPPASYQGPKPTSLLGAAVFFRTSDEWILVGEEKNGVSVMDIKDPWTVVLGHKGGEYEVPLWGERKAEFFTTEYDGSVRSSGIVKQEAPERNSARGGSQRSDYNKTIPIPDPISDEKIRSMSRTEASDGIKSVMAAIRRTDLDESTEKRLQHELEELRKRLRNAS